MSMRRQRNVEMRNGEGGRRKGEGRGGKGRSIPSDVRRAEWRPHPITKLSGGIRRWSHLLKYSTLRVNRKESTSPFWGLGVTLGCFLFRGFMTSFRFFDDSGIRIPQMLIRRRLYPPPPPLQDHLPLGGPPLHFISSTARLCEAQNPCKVLGNHDGVPDIHDRPENFFCLSLSSSSSQSSSLLLRCSSPHEEEVRCLSFSFSFPFSLSLSLSFLSSASLLFFEARRPC